VSGFDLAVTLGLVALNALAFLYTRNVALSIERAVAGAKRELDAYKLHVAEEYVPYERFDRTADKIFDKLDRLAARLPPQE